MSRLMSTEIEIGIQSQLVTLRGDGTLYLPGFRSLLAADLHLGKDASFRAAGVPVPGGIDEVTLQQLSLALHESRAERLYVLGDLIHDRHSMTSRLVRQFCSWRESHPRLSLILVRGNHDRHVSRFPTGWRMETCRRAVLGPFHLMHEVSSSSPPVDSIERESIEVGGHLHPVARVGRGADQMRLRCFLVGDRQIVLPALGPFKGGMPVKKGRQKLYPICDGKVFSGMPEC